MWTISFPHKLKRGALKFEPKQTKDTVARKAAVFLFLSRSACFSSSTSARFSFMPIDLTLLNTAALKSRVDEMRRYL
jgi:hypothetical protein